MERRRFTIFDGMVLVAATAIGLEASMLCKRTYDGSIELVIKDNILSATPFPVVWSITLLGLRLKGPRPSLRRIAKQPGIVVCLATVPAMVLGVMMGARNLIRLFYQSHVDADDFLLEFTEHSIFLVPPCVVACWWTLAMSGMWRREKDWIGIMGRLIGILWIALFVGWVMVK